MNELIMGWRNNAPAMLKLGVGSLLLALLAGCSEGPDMSAVAIERERALRRYDVSQAIAANDQVLVSGTQGGAVLVSADRGATWQRTELGQASLVDIAVCPDGGFVAVDHYSKVWSVDAKGAQWTSVPLEQPETPIAVACDPQGVKGQVDAKKNPPSLFQVQNLRGGD